VRFFVDDRLVGTRSTGPWRLRLYAPGLAAGAHGVRVLLEDGRGNAAISPRAVVVKR
jgi:hypothetical protein